MRAESFAYWLQGYFEINKASENENKELTTAQVEVIQNHLNMVFIHDIDPKLGDAEHQAKLDEAHSGFTMDDAPVSIGGPSKPFPRHMSLQGNNPNRRLKC